MIFMQRTHRIPQQLVCQRASECLAVYPTPDAIFKAKPEDLSQYFDGIGLQNKKPPFLIQLAKAYIKDPPQQGKLRSKSKCPKSEISHLPQIGETSVNTWLVYCCNKTDVVTEDKKLIEYMKYVRTEAAAN